MLSRDREENRCVFEVIRDEKKKKKKMKKYYKWKLQRNSILWWLLHWLRSKGDWNWIGNNIYIYLTISSIEEKFNFGRKSWNIINLWMNVIK